MKAAETIPRHHILGELLLREGYHELAPGQLASLTTYFRRGLQDVEEQPGAMLELSLEPLTADVARYRALFRLVGAEWLWFGRLELDDAGLAAILSDPAITAFAAMDDEGDAGMVEIDFRNPEEAEITYFGLVPRLIGKGLGRILMQQALLYAKARGATSIMLHTCDLDAPGAIGFYQKSGFKPYRRAIEVLADPRLSGLLPREVAARIPLIEI
jgi:GNAT superfamily N-acetyltransferase